MTNNARSFILVALVAGLGLSGLACDDKLYTRAPDKAPSPELDALEDGVPEDAAPPAEAHPENALRLVLIEDRSNLLGGYFPGADIDAISLIKADGTIYHAQDLNHFTEVDCEDNLACDPSAMLGPPDLFTPDLGCPDAHSDLSRITSLNGGYAMLEFSSETQGDVIIENGDTIHVHAFADTQCSTNREAGVLEIGVAVAQGEWYTFHEIAPGASPGDFIVEGF